jgi:preprotein translocase subunit SecE
MQRQGQIGPDGAPAPRTQPRPAPRATQQRLSPAAYTREVRAELRKVAWPTRAEVVNYSVVVLFTVIVLTALIFGLDYLFAKAVLFLFDS